MEHAYVTLCLFPLSPRGTKARRATFTRREKGCAWFLNRWDESSVLVRYAAPLSSVSLSLFPSLILYYSCFLMSFIFIYLTFITHFPHSSYASFSFDLRFPQAPLFVSASFYLSLLFPICLALDMLPKTTSTLCFPLLTLEWKGQREEEKELQKIDSML